MWLTLLLSTPAGALDRGADGEFGERSSAHFQLFQDVAIDRAGGIYGTRQRLSIERVVGTVGWTTYGMDLRRYDAILFNFLTLATRLAQSKIMKCAANADIMTMRGQ